MTANMTLQFICPPEHQGQIVTVSYALDYDREVIIERWHDASDGSVSYTAYAIPDDPDWEWAPWSVVPELGPEIGPCQIREG